MTLNKSMSLCTAFDMENQSQNNSNIQTYDKE